MMQGFDISRLSPGDIGLLQKLSKETFSETFAAVNSEENMRKYLEDEFSKEKLSKELIDKNSEFYFANFEGKAIAYLKINFGPAQTEIQSDKSMEIERIYVLKEFHRSGVGLTLLNHAIQIAREKNTSYIWLGVWERNFKALQFYKKHGFYEFNRHFFKLGHDVKTDIMMKRDLAEF